MKIGFRLHRREHCLRANKRMKRWPGAAFWLTFGQFLMAAHPSNTLSCCKSPTVIVQCQVLKQLLDCQRVDMAQSQQRNLEDYLSESVEAGWVGYRVKKEKGRGAERMNHLKKGNLMTVKLLINLADTGTMCAHACAVCLSPVFEGIQH